MSYRMNRDGSAALSLLSEQGFDLPEQPEQRAPVLPLNLTEIEDSELMETFAKMTAWCDYAMAQVGLASITERDAEHSLEMAEAAFWKKMPKSSAVTSIRETMPSDPAVADARSRLIEVYAYKRVISDVAARFERDAAALSRELTRRSNGKEKTRDRWASS